MDMGQVMVVGTEAKVTSGHIRIRGLPIQGLGPDLAARDRYVEQINPVFVVQTDVARRQINVKDDGLFILEYRPVSGLISNRNQIACDSPGEG